MKDGDLYEEWWFGILNGLVNHSGLYNTQPLLDFLRKFFLTHGSAYHRKLVVSSVDANSGSYVTWNETSNDLAKAVVSSAAIPFIFPDQIWMNGVVALDGGSAWGTNLVSAIQRCGEITEDNAQIILDVIVCDGNQIADWKKRKSAISNYLRQRDIKSYHDSLADIRTFMRAFPAVNYRYYVEPSEPLASGEELLDVNNSTNTWPMQMIGRKDGEAIVKLGEGFLFQKLEQWDDSSAGITIPNLSEYIKSAQNTTKIL